jgi:hypothetical protein
VNHPASVNTSSSLCAVPLRPSDISFVPSRNLKPNPRGGTANKMSSYYEKLLTQLRTRRSNRPLNSKPIGLRRMLFLVLQEGRWGFCRDPAPSDTPSRSDMTWLFLPLMIGRKKRYITLTVCSALLVVLKTTMDTMCEMFQIGAQTLCWCGGRLCLWVLSGVNRLTVLCLVYSGCIGNFVYFVLFFVLSLQIIHILKLGTRVRLSRGGEAFRKTNFTPLFFP